MKKRYTKDFQIQKIERRIIKSILRSIKKGDEAGVTLKKISAGSWCPTRLISIYVSRLVKEGLIVESENKVAGTDKKKKVYTLTDAGRDRLKKKKKGKNKAA